MPDNKTAAVRRPVTKERKQLSRVHPTISQTVDNL